MLKATVFLSLVLFGLVVSRPVGDVDTKQESEDDLTKQVDSLNTQLVAVKNALQTCQGRGSCENNLSKCQSSLSYSTKEIKACNDRCDEQLKPLLQQQQQQQSRNQYPQNPKQQGWNQDRNQYPQNPNQQGWNHGRNQYPQNPSQQGWNHGRNQHPQNPNQQGWNQDRNQYPQNPNQQGWNHGRNQYPQNPNQQGWNQGRNQYPQNPNQQGWNQGRNQQSMNQQGGNQQSVDLVHQLIIMLQKEQQQSRIQYPQNQNQQTGNQDNIRGLQGTSNKGSISNENQNMKQHFLVDQTPINHPNKVELNTSQPASSNGRASDDELKHNKTLSETRTEETNSSSSKIETFHHYNKEDNERPQHNSPFIDESNMQDLYSDTVFEDTSLQLGASDDDEGVDDLNNNKKKHQDNLSGVAKKYTGHSSWNFLTIFLFIGVIVVVGYFLLHNRKKITDIHRPMIEYKHICLTAPVFQQDVVNNLPNK